MISIKKLIAVFGALLISSSALANVTYRWVGDSTNTGYGKDVQVQITLTDSKQYSGNEASCTMYSHNPCFNEPGIDLVDLTFGVSGEWMTLDPRTNRYAGTGWDIHVIGGAGNVLSGFIRAYDWSNDIRMSGSGDNWTIQRIGSDRGLVLEDVTGRFEAVPEPGQLLLMLAGLAVLVVARRKTN